MFVIIGFVWKFILKLIFKNNPIMINTIYDI